MSDKQTAASTEPTKVDREDWENALRGFLVQADADANRLLRRDAVVERVRRRNSNRTRVRTIRL